ncbi:hypothetical protein FWH30_02970 [Microgenomates group bacterium]|nr:hypothetical protein [Microgenomates group bacterium]
MKKRVLIIYDMVGMAEVRGGAKPNIFAKEYPELEIAADEIRYDEVVVDWSDLEGRVWLKNERRVEDYDLVYMRATGGSQLAMMLGKVVKIDFFPKFYVNEVYYPSKAVQLDNLVKEKLSAIPAVVGYGAGLLNYIAAHESLWTGETIVKPNIGAKGRGVRRAANRGELIEMLRERQGEFLIWQPLIESEGEGRCLVLGGEVRWSAWRDGEMRRLKKWEASEEVKKMAGRAAEANGLEAAGVDLMFDKKKQRWVILEVNTAAGFRTFDRVTGEKTDELLMRYLCQQLA